MNTKAILGELKQERNRLHKAIAALEVLGDVAVARKPGRPKESPTSFNFGANKARGGRKMSAAARRKISEMMKKWWAQRRKGKA
jgi:hypothetical protein